MVWGEASGDNDGRWPRVAPCGRSLLYNADVSSLLRSFEEVVRRRPDHLALCDPALMLRYAELQAVAMGLAERIVAQTGRRQVGILAPTSVVGAASILACWYADRVPVPMNFMLAPEELSAVAQDAGVDCVLAIDKFVPLVAALERFGMRSLVLDSKSVVPGRVATAHRAGSDLAVILYTSGTQGRPKGVCLTIDNVYNNARAAIEAAELGQDEVLLSVLPQFHSFGLTAMTIVPLLLGATVHYLPRFSPVAVVETIAERKITVFMAVASMYAALLGMKSAPPNAFQSLRLAISGGEALPPNVFAGFRERFGVTICEGYGLTEASPIVSLNNPESNRPGSVGRALPGIEVYAADVQGRPLSAGETGELLIRGHCVMRGYHNQPDATAAAIRAGVLASGDVGHVDADGYIHITGRAKEMIIVGGENVYPREIENVMLQHPAVAEAAVIGVRDALRGEQPVAFVILRAGATATDLELRAFCKDRLAGYKVPRNVQIAEDLPRGPTGKILKRALLKELKSPDSGST